MNSKIFEIIILIIVPLLFAISVVGLVASLISITIKTSQVLTNRKEKSSLWKDGLGNPFNSILRTDQLTGAGIEYRKRLIFWISIAVGSVVIGLLCSFLMTIFPA